MNHKVLALKFRPQIFDEVVGQEHITVTLKNAIKNNRIAHAYLFSGSRGVGKTTTARILAKSLNCEKGITVYPCNKCKNCREITDSISMDVEEIDGASNRGINEIRELKERAKTFPLNSRYKIFIIDEVHMLTNEAFNALLKVLEEPPDFVVFIFATTEPYKIPMTILSRCQRFDFKRISLVKIVENFKKVLESEDVDIPDNILFRVAKKSEGSMRDGLSLLEQVINFYYDENSKKYIDDILGYSNVSFFNELMKYILEKDYSNALSLLNKIFYEGVDFKELARDFIEYLQNIITLIYLPDKKDLIEDSPDNIEDMISLIDKVDRFFISTVLNLLMKEYEHIRYSEFPEINFKLFILKIMDLTNLKSIDEVIKNLKNIKIEVKEPKIVENKKEKKEAKFEWKKFLNFISYEQPILYGFVSDATILEQNNEKIKIEVNKIIPDKDKLSAELQDYIYKLYKIKLKVEIVINKKLEFKHKVLQNEIINDILTLFNGEIEKIKYKQEEL